MSEAFCHDRGLIVAIAVRALKKINDLSIGEEKNKCFVWSIVFVEPLGDREWTERRTTFQPRIQISVTLLSGFAGYRCAAP